MKDEEYEPIPINELLDLLSKNWGVPYDAEKQIWEYVCDLRYALMDIRQKDSANLQMGGYRKGSFGWIADTALNLPPTWSQNDS